MSLRLFRKCFKKNHFVRVICFCFHCLCHCHFCLFVCFKIAFVIVKMVLIHVNCIIKLIFALQWVCIPMRPSLAWPPCEWWHLQWLLKALLCLGPTRVSSASCWLVTHVSSWAGSQWCAQSLSAGGFNDGQGLLAYSYREGGDHDSIRLCKLSLWDIAVFICWYCCWNYLQWRKMFFESKWLETNCGLCKTLTPWILCYFNRQSP